MAKAPKKRKIKGEGLDSKLSKIKTLVHIRSLPLVQRELIKKLSTPKIPKVPTSLNAIIIKREYDSIIDVQCNGSMLRGVLVDRGRIRLNIMTTPIMKYLGLKNDKMTLIIF